MNQRTWNWIEGIATAVALATLLVWLGQHWVFYADSSLWIDEIISIQAFISGGPKASLGTYTSNNHMLFSFLNSILPGNDSFEPFRARFLSLFAVVAGAAVGLTFLLRRGWRLESLLFAVCALGASSFLKLNLQARGYGLMFLASVVICVALLRYFEDRKRGHLIWISVAVFCGGWSVPSFLFWAGVLMMIVAGWQLVRRERWFEITIAGAIVLVVTLIAFLPAISYYRDPEAVESMFGSEKQYGEWRAIPRTIWEYLTTWSAPTVRQSAVGAFMVMLAAIALPLARIRLEKPVWKTSALMLISIVAFFLICRFLEKPFIRTTAFIVVPIGFVIAYGLRNLLPDSVSSRRMLTTVIAALIVIGWAPQIRGLELLPREAWRETAALVEDLTPNVSRGYAHVRSKNYTRLYLPDTIQFGDAFDDSAFAAGQQLLVDANFYLPPEERLDSIGKHAHVVQIDVPQLRGDSRETRWMRLAFVAPHGSGLTDLSIGHQPGSSSGQTFQIDAKIAETGAGRLLLYSPALKHTKPPKVKLLRERGSWKTLEIGGERKGDLWMLTGPFEPGSTIKISYYVDEPADEIEGFSIWASPILD